MLPRNQNRSLWRRSVQTSPRGQCDIYGRVKTAGRRGEARHTQLWAELVDAGDEEGYAERTAHHRVFIVHALSETECEVAYCLCDALYLDALVVGEGVVLGCDAGVVDNGTRVGGEAGHRTPEMCVDLHDFLY